MYFLRWLYREVNPMILILGLVLLYFLFSLATCSNSRNSLDVDTDIVKTEDAQTVTESNTEVVAQIDEEVAVSAENVAVSADADATPVESALSKVFNDKQVTADAPADSEEAEIVEEAVKPSVLSRVFKQAPDEQNADAESSSIPEEVNQVAEEVVEGASKAGAVVTGTAVAAAGAVAAVVGDDADADATPEVDVDTPEVEVAEEEKGGFFGLFNRSPKSDEDLVEQTEEATSADMVAEEAVVEEVAVEDQPAPLVSVEEAEEVVETETVTEQAVEEEVAEVAVDAAPVTVVPVEEVAEVVNAEVATEEALEEEVAVEEVAVEEAPVEEVVVEEVAEEAPAEVVVAETEQAEGAVPPPPSYSTNISTDTDGLSAARRAYWDRDYASADSLYSGMIANEPENAELIAEYGNMLLQSGQVEKTLDAYETAAGLMIDSGRKLEAKPLIDYISSWDQARADALINKVFAQ